ncbi:MAG TPA: hypothetical protein VM933_02895 [Acidimicrobiales bacterium]|nr:hypothetical protein [Acidimicrobiales bacterium]
MIVEVLTFRPREGVTEAELRAAERRVYEDFAMQQAGMVRRTTAVSADGEWLVVQLWGDAASADAGERNAADHPATAELHALADPDTLTSRRYQDLGG